MERLFREVSPVQELAFNVDTTSPLDAHERHVLQQILAEGFMPETVSKKSLLGMSENIMEIGPRFITAVSTNLVAICHACGLTKVTRIELSRRHALPVDADRDAFKAANHDKMTEQEWLNPLQDFGAVRPIEAVYKIPLKEKGPNALLNVPGLAMDAWDRQFYYDYFVLYEGRDPTNVEILDLNNANSEHCRHGYFRGQQVIDGMTMPETLMDIIMSTLQANSYGSVIAFCDNSSAIEGYSCWTLIPQYPGMPSELVKKRIRYNFIFTAETHNFPTGIAPFQGAATGAGGRLRDILATGRGALVMFGTAGYCVGNLLIEGYVLPWEDKALLYPSNMATPLQILIQGSDGISRYSNEYGEPLGLGTARSYDIVMPDGRRYCPIKPVLFTGGMGKMDARHSEKGEAEPGLLIVVVGGEAQPVGFGGGAASSKLQEEGEEDLNLHAVQRADAQMQKKMDIVFRFCIAMGIRNPIISLHDQGAGGVANLLKELVEKAGGRIELRKIVLGDPNMSVVEIWIAEYQERCGLLIHPDRIEEFKAMCEREEVNCEVLGEVTADGRFIVHDEEDDSTPVNVKLAEVLGKMPQKIFMDRTIKPVLTPLKLPPDLTIESALYWVLRLLVVGSKEFLTGKADRSVKGLSVIQQCCGMLQIPVADMLVAAATHFGVRGVATSMGEQPIKLLIDPAAGARLAVTEAITNMMWAVISKLEAIKCSVNWMWAPKLPGEGAAMYAAAVAMRDFMIELGIAADGGKDSLSMVVKVLEDMVRSRELIISTYAPVPNFNHAVTPDIQRPGESEIIWIPLTGQARLGASALAHVHGQLGDDCPDMNNAALLKRAFIAVQQLIGEGLILAGHDVSDGGLITALLEMIFAGNCGLQVTMQGPHSALATCFAEEPQLVFEADMAHTAQIHEMLARNDVPSQTIAKTTVKKEIVVEHNGESVLQKETPELLEWWRATSHEIYQKQGNPETAEERKRNTHEQQGHAYTVSFTPEPTPAKVMRRVTKPKLAILRAPGSHGDEEMKAAFHKAGFKTLDVHMSDLIAGKISLEEFVGLAAVGGFAHADVIASAKGWASIIRLNPKLKEMFDDFYNRPDTFSLGVCNGFQLFTLLGWLPFPGIPDEKQPRLVKNLSCQFESQWARVRILDSPAIMLKGMAGSCLGVWVAHGEGRLYLPDYSMLNQITARDLAPVRYIDDNGEITEGYPFNPNGSPLGIAALCDPTGRHLGMMPHPERLFELWQWPYLPEKLKRQLAASPWLQMFQNAYFWCRENR